MSACSFSARACSATLRRCTGGIVTKRGAVVAWSGRVGRQSCVQPVAVWTPATTRGFASWADDDTIDTDSVPPPEELSEADVHEQAPRPPSRRKHDGVRLYRHYKPIRDDPMHANFGMMKDIMEHEYWCDRERENMPGGWPIPFNPSQEEVKRSIELNDEQVRAGQLDPMLDDPWINGYLTEDEIMFSEDYKPQPYLPDKVKQQMYYLFCNEGWDIKRLSKHFGVRSERVGMILNMKRTEPDMKATGRYREDIDRVFTKLYSGRFKDFVEKGESNDQGLNMAVLKDDQLPDDVLPTWNVPPTAPKLHYRLPPVPTPPREKRKFKSKYVFKDVNITSARASALRVVDYDGTVRPATTREAAARTWRMQRWTVKADAGEDPLDFNPMSTSASAAATLGDADLDDGSGGGQQQESMSQ